MKVNTQTNSTGDFMISIKTLLCTPARKICTFFGLEKSLVNLTVDSLNINGDVIKEAEWIKIFSITDTQSATPSAAFVIFQYEF